MSTKFRYEPGSLFLKGPKMSLNACVGTNGGPYDFAAYSDGYFRAADAVVRRVLDGEPLLDLFIYPAIYLYRHGCELALKGLLVDLAELEERPRAFPKVHHLDDLWREFEGRARKTEGLFDAKDLRTMRALMIDLDRLDRTAETFRFPEDRSGQLHLQDRSLINYERLKPLSDARELFEDWSCALSDALDGKREQDNEFSE